MKTKKYHFDIEMIIDHEVQVIGKEKVNISTHRIMRDYNLNALCELIRLNDVPEDENVKITLNIRGVNY